MIPHFAPAIAPPLPPPPPPVQDRALHMDCPAGHHLAVWEWRYQQTGGGTDYLSITCSGCDAQHKSRR